MNRRPTSRAVALMAALLLGAMPAAAQSEAEDPTLLPWTEAEVPITHEETALDVSAEDYVEAMGELSGAFGEELQDYWIAAPQFHPRTATDWNYFGGLYYFAANGTGDRLFEAQVELPAGARVELLECLVHDSDASVDGTVGFWKHRYNYLTNFQDAIHITTVSSSGSSGYQKPFEATNETIRYRHGDFRNIYTLVATLPGTNGNVRLRGCRFFWRRQIMPAPSTATFGDVPTSHPFFRQIEALASSGITGGCDASNFCPNAPLTRGQMAVFLAKALGLHWPY